MAILTQQLLQWTFTSRWPHFNFTQRQAYCREWCCRRTFTYNYAMLFRFFTVLCRNYYYNGSDFREGPNALRTLTTKLLWGSGPRDPHGIDVYDPRVRRASSEHSSRRLQKGRGDQVEANTLAAAHGSVSLVREITQGTMSESCDNVRPRTCMDNIKLVWLWN